LTAPPGRPWNLLLPVVFALGSADFGLASIIEPRSIGSHAVIYTEAARAWLSGGDPWTVGPPGAVFAGPPTMLVAFVPFVALPADLTRIVWVAGMAILAIFVLRRFRLPGWWIGFPPIFHAIQLGHPEVLVMWLVVLGGPIAGLAPAIKPYSGLPLLAEQRWRAIAIWLAVVLLTAPFLPWRLFIERLPDIARAFAEYSHGDSTFGAPILMLIAIVALGSLGIRRALWLATPLLWPGAQPIYKAVSTPAMSPLLAVFWALPVPIVVATNASLVGVVVEAAVRRYAALRPIPTWLRSGIDGGPWREPDQANQHASSRLEVAPLEAGPGADAEAKAARH
jgi:hypothetical protein